MSTSSRPASPDGPAPALILIAHGSPDPDWRRPLELLQARIAGSLGEDRVALAYLAHPPRLDDAIEQLAGFGHREVVIVAALLSPGGRHVKQDIPDAVAAARERFGQLELRLVPGVLGDDEDVIAALTEAALRRLRRDAECAGLRCSPLRPR